MMLRGGHGKSPGLNCRETRVPIINGGGPDKVESSSSEKATIVEIVVEPQSSPALSPLNFIYTDGDVLVDNQRALRMQALYMM